MYRLEQPSVIGDFDLLVRHAHSRGKPDRRMGPVLFALFAVDVLGTVAGIFAMRSRLVSAKVTMISAGVMIGVALFWIFPEIRQKSGLMHAGLVVVVALVALYAIDRMGERILYEEWRFRGGPLWAAAPI
jgi:hypothetical protein